MKHKRLLGLLLILVCGLGLLALTNPTTEDFVDYQVALVMAEIADPDSDVRDVLGPIGAAGAEVLIRGQTTRRNFLLFSTYTYEPIIGGGGRTYLGIAGTFTEI